MTISLDPGLWLQALLTIAVFMILFGENLLSRWAEHSLIAATASIFTVVAVKAVIESGIKPLLAGDIAYIIPLMFAALIYTRFIPQLRFLNRWSLAFMVGAINGVLISRMVSVDIITNIRQYMRPLIVAGDPMMSISHIVSLIAIITVLFYFTFTITHTGTKRTIANTGKYLLFGYLGYQFSCVMLSRLLLLSERWTFILYDFLGFG